MEKNQHNHDQMRDTGKEHKIPAAAPGQELPRNPGVTGKTKDKEKEERHSESSLPQNDEETLGTP